MLLPVIGLLVGLVVLVWSADRFVEGASAVAQALRVPPLVIGMVIIGFGTSAPELIVSAVAALDNNPGLALGNAYGSNIANIGLVIGSAALLVPMVVSSGVVKREFPVLIGITLVSGFQILDGHLGRVDAAVLLVLFAVVMGVTLWQASRKPQDELNAEINAEVDADGMGLGKGSVWLVLGLLLLIASSRLLVWGAVEVATAFGVSEVIIGLTVVAVGTSLPELASALAAVRKKEHDLVLGNILGSAVFNTLAVVGIAAALRPFSVDGDIILRDWPVMMGLSLLLMVMCLGRRKKAGQVNRLEAGSLLTIYGAYTAYLVYLVLQGNLALPV